MATYAIELQNATVTSLGTTAREDWTLRVDVREDTIEQILTAKDPLTEALAALNSKEVKITGRTFGKKIKLGLLNLGLKLAGIFR